MELQALTAISSVDGRYAGKTAPLRAYYRQLLASSIDLKMVVG